MIVPTIGRVVLIQGRGESDQAEPAFITYVHSNTMINVAGFSKNGSPFGRTSVPLKQEDSEVYHGIYAEWMPYQKQVAAKQDSKE